MERVAGHIQRAEARATGLRVSLLSHGGKRGCFRNAVPPERTTDMDVGLGAATGMCNT